MKKAILSLTILLVAIGITLHVTATEIEYTSRVTPDDCVLCKDHNHSVNSQYWEQDNIGILDLNTFDILPIRINRYDDSGNLDLSEYGIMESNGMHRDDTYVHSMTHPDRGYATVQISGAEYKTSRKSVQSNLCASCIDAMNCVFWSEEDPPEFAVINYSERTIRPLDRDLTWFFLGNFGIDCEYKENGDIHLLIVYLPPRSR